MTKSEIIKDTKYNMIDNKKSKKIRREMDQLIPISNKSSHSAPIDVDVVNGD